MLAFGAGALIVAVAFELFVPAHREVGLATASAALLVGSCVFIVVDLALQRHAGSEATGLALVASVTLDGIPENFALGVGLAEGGSLALLAAIAASNFPEAFGGAAAIRSAGRSAAHAFGVWAVTAALLTVALIAGRLAAEWRPKLDLGYCMPWPRARFSPRLPTPLCPRPTLRGVRWSHSRRTRLPDHVDDHRLRRQMSRLTSSLEGRPRLGSRLSIHAARRISAKRAFDMAPFAADEWLACCRDGVAVLLNSD